MANRHDSGIVARITSNEAPLPGTYPATFRSIEERHSEKYNSIFWLWTFEVEKPDGAIVDVTGPTGTKTTSGTKTVHWLTAVFGRELSGGDDVAFDDLVGNRCRLVLDVEAKDGNEYAQIVDVLPAPPAAATVELPLPV